MADTNETIADIIAWLRRPRAGENAYLTLWRDEIAARIEAAHRRERGDCVKLREALESIASNLEHRLFARYPSSASDEWMYQKANTALAATEKEGEGDADK